MFDTSLLSREAKKPELANALLEKIDNNTAPNGDVHHVIDGGAQLQLIPWTCCVTFESILERYAN